ncbi:MAG: sulfatase-like hydrolase/transferase, partial [Bdellovibrionales bacterium]|nr:sulfatase-like hydrolase/transferase [Bdellovibrionales bacterium]
IQGEWKTQEGYMTTLLEKYAIQFLEQAQQEKKPWFLALPFNAPHLPLTLPKEKDRKHKSISEIPIRKNDNVIPTGAPTWLKEKKPFSPKMRKRLLEQRLEQREALSILDESIERIIANLKQGGSYENTLIFFLSDNGLFFGEHRLQSKDAIYEEATKVPFAIRKPGQAQGTLNQALVANIDIAPTIFDYAEVPKPWHMDGISLKPLLEQNEEIQPRMLLVEGFRRAGPRNAFSALHTGGEVFVTQHYIATEPNEYELYDLDEDEFQLTNRVEDLKKKDSVSTLKHNLLETIKEMRGSLIVELPKEKRLPAKISGPKRKDLKRSPQL